MFLSVNTINNVICVPPGSHGAKVKHINTSLNKNTQLAFTVKTMSNENKLQSDGVMRKQVEEVITFRQILKGTQNNTVFMLLLFV